MAWAWQGRSRQPCGRFLFGGSTSKSACGHKCRFVPHLSVYFLASSSPSFIQRLLLYHHLASLSPSFQHLFPHSSCHFSHEHPLFSVAHHCAHPDDCKSLDRLAPVITSPGLAPLSCPFTTSWKSYPRTTRLFCCRFSRKPGLRISRGFDNTLMGVGGSPARAYDDAHSLF